MSFSCVGSFRQVSLSVKRVVQECENLRADLGNTHRTLSESQQREKERVQVVDELRGQLADRSTECGELKQSLADCTMELDTMKGTQHSGQSENAMYQSLLKDQSELLATVRRVAEEEATRHQMAQEHLERELKTERHRAVAFSQQVSAKLYLYGSFVSGIFF